MKLSHLLTATVAALTLSLPAFAANDSADASMGAKASMPHQKMDSKMMQKNDAAMKEMKNGDMKDSAMNMKEDNMKDSSMNMKETAMKDSSMNMKDDAMKNMKMEMININSADASTIAKAKLKGISMKKAEAIVAYREKNGNFQSINDLANVKGISKKIVSKIKDRLTVG